MASKKDTVLSSKKVSITLSLFKVWVCFFISYETINQLWHYFRYFGQVSSSQREISGESSKWL